MGLVLADQGRHQEAIACYRRAIALKPELVLAQYNLGLALKAEGNTAEATVCLREVLRLDPGNELATFSLSSLTAQNPERPPQRYIANLFDNHAPRFDTHLVETLRYRVPRALVDVALKHANPPQSGWDVLDLGCGTGLVGVAVAPFAHHLVGVDLSLRMLEKARERNLYDRLEHRDLLSMMKLEPASSYDIISAADVFIYVGKLDDVVREAARLLRIGGTLVFSVEAIEETPIRRYGHGALARLPAPRQRPLCTLHGLPAETRARQRIRQGRNIGRRYSARTGRARARLAGAAGSMNRQRVAGAGAEGAGASTIRAPRSFSSRWNSGFARMIVPAAARRRSTASGGR